MATQRIFIFPNDDKKGDQPDFYIRAKDTSGENQKNIKDIGAAWEKGSPVGVFYDGQLGGQYNEDFWLLSAEEYSEYRQLKREARGDDYVEKPKIDYPDSDADLDSIPF